jgi:hypothetical protein
VGLSWLATVFGSAAATAAGCPDGWIEAGVDIEGLDCSGGCVTEADTDRDCGWLTGAVANAGEMPENATEDNVEDICSTALLAACILATAVATSPKRFSLALKRSSDAPSACLICPKLASNDAVEDAMRTCTSCLISASAR